MPQKPRNLIPQVTTSPRHAYERWWCPSIACMKYAQRACLLYPPEARNTIHLRSALWSAPSAPVVMGSRPAGHVSKRRNSLTRCAPWPEVIRFPEPHPREELDRPNYAGRCHGRGVDHGSPAELSRSTRFSRTARPVSDQCQFIVHLYTLSRDTTRNC